jgi:hypothetical protein
MHNPILITGIPRSGASMIAAAFKVCGAFNGNVDKMQMNCNISDLIKRYFEFIGCEGIPETKDILILNNWREKVETVLNNETFIEGQWMYKDSNSALIWPLWNHAYPHAKWIIVRRKTNDIISSCTKTVYMHPYKGTDNWATFIHTYEKKFVEMIETGLNCKQIWPERMVEGDYSQMYETLDWCGLEWKKEVVDLIEPMLWNSRQKERGK